MYFYYLYDLMIFIISVMFGNVLFWAYMYGWVKQTYNAFFKSKHMKYSLMARQVIFVFFIIIYLPTSNTLCFPVYIKIWI